MNISTETGSQELRQSADSISLWIHLLNNENDISSTLGPKRIQNKMK